MTHRGPFQPLPFCDSGSLDGGHGHGGTARQRQAILPGSASPDPYRCPVESKMGLVHTTVSEPLSNAGERHEAITSGMTPSQHTCEEPL